MGQSESHPTCFGVLSGLLELGGLDELVCLERILNSAALCGVAWPVKRQSDGTIIDAFLSYDLAFNSDVP